MNDMLLVSTDWLARHLDDPQVRIVDIRGHVISANSPDDDFRGHYESYVQSHIPNAVFMDWVAHLSDDRDHLRVAPAGQFARVMGDLGIGPDTLVIAYDNAGNALAARLWWALNYYGHSRVAVLDGGWRKWLAEERPMSDEMPLVEATEFTAQTNGTLRRHGDDILHLLNSTARIVDLRAPDEYEGETSLARQRGHIPGAVNLPANRFTTENGTLHKPATLRQLFAEVGIDGSEPEVIFYSNVGVDACLGLLGFAVAGFEHGSLYDESWQEWGNDERKPVEGGTGAPSPASV